MSYTIWARRWVRVCLAWIVLAIAGPAYADLSPLNGAAVAANIAEIRVLDDRVEVALEIYVGDLEVFDDLLPDDWFRGDAARDRPAEAERLRRFSETGLQIRANGVLLEPRLALVEPRRRVDRLADLARTAGQRTGAQFIPKPPEDDRVIYVDLVYPFDERPDTLEFSPPVPAPGAPQVSIGFVVFHASVHVMDFRFLSGPETLRLDWFDPWYSRFDNKNLKRHHDSGLLTFLYVEPREVRHETLIRVRDLQEFVDLDLDPAATQLTVADQTRITETARTFFAELSPLEVDGAVAAQLEARAEFLTITASGVQVAEEGTALDPATALIGVIVSTPVTALPETVMTRWPLFNARIPRVQATTYDPAGPFVTLLDPSVPEIEWTNFLTQWEEPVARPVDVPTVSSFDLPWLSGLLVLGGAVALGSALLSTGRARFGAGFGVLASVAGAVLALPVTAEVELPVQRAPDTAAAQAVMEGLVDNIATTMLETEADGFDAALALFVKPDHAEFVGAEIRRGLTVTLPSSAKARTEEITDLSVEEIADITDGSGYQILATWTAQVVGGHWGHLHRRQITYRGLVDVSQTDGLWHLDGLTILSGQPAS